MGLYLFSRRGIFLALVIFVGFSGLTFWMQSVDNGKSSGDTSRHHHDRYDDINTFTDLRRGVLEEVRSSEHHPSFSLESGAKEEEDFSSYFTKLFLSAQEKTSDSRLDLEWIGRMIHQFPKSANLKRWGGVADVTLCVQIQCSPDGFLDDDQPLPNNEETQQKKSDDLRRLRLFSESFNSFGGKLDSHFSRLVNTVMMSLLLGAKFLAFDDGCGGALSSPEQRIFDEHFTSRSLKKLGLTVVHGLCSNSVSAADLGGTTTTALTEDSSLMFVDTMGSLSKIPSSSTIEVFEQTAISLLKDEIRSHFVSTTGDTNDQKDGRGGRRGTGNPTLSPPLVLATVHIPVVVVGDDWDVKHISGSSSRTHDSLNNNNIIDPAMMVDPLSWYKRLNTMSEEVLKSKWCDPLWPSALYGAVLSSFKFQVPNQKALEQQIYFSSSTGNGSGSEHSMSSKEDLLSDNNDDLPDNSSATHTTTAATTVIPLTETHYGVAFLPAYRGDRAALQRFFKHTLTVHGILKTQGLPPLSWIVITPNQNQLLKDASFQRIINNPRSHWVVRGGEGFGSSRSDVGDQRRNKNQTIIRGRGSKEMIKLDILATGARATVSNTSRQNAAEAMGEYDHRVEKYAGNMTKEQLAAFHVSLAIEATRFYSGMVPSPLAWVVENMRRLAKSLPGGGPRNHRRAKAEMSRWIKKKKSSEERKKRKEEEDLLMRGSRRSTTTYNQTFNREELVFGEQREGEDSGHGREGLLLSQLLRLQKQHRAESFMEPFNSPSAVAVVSASSQNRNSQTRGDSPPGDGRQKGNSPSKNAEDGEKNTTIDYLTSVSYNGLRGCSMWDMGTSATICTKSPLNPHVLERYEKFWRRRANLSGVRSSSLSVPSPKLLCSLGSSNEGGSHKHHGNFRQQPMVPYSKLTITQQQEGRRSVKILEKPFPHSVVEVVKMDLSSSTSGAEGNDDDKEKRCRALLDFSTNNELRKETNTRLDVASKEGDEADKSNIRMKTPLRALYDTEIYECNKSSETTGEKRGKVRSSTALSSSSSSSSFDHQFGWVFERYHPSPFENDWLEAVKTVDRTAGSVCRLVINTSFPSLPGKSFADRFDRYLTALPRMAPHIPSRGQSSKRKEKWVFKRTTSEETPEQRQHQLRDWDESKKEISSRVVQFNLDSDLQCKRTAGDGEDHDEVEELPRSGFDSDIFSRFEYRCECLNPPCHDHDHHRKSSCKPSEVKFAFIEPLVGILRHPQVCRDAVHDTRNGSPPFSVHNKNYMLVDSWPLRHTHRRHFLRNRNTTDQHHHSQAVAVPPAATKKDSILGPKDVIYFDAGASVWDSGRGGASMSWFHAIYDIMCVVFKRFVVWEAKWVPEADRGIPEDLIPKFDYHNVPLSTKLDSWENPLNHILKQVPDPSTATVVYKIDFDQFRMELEMIQTILDHPEVAGRIGELFFEHHVCSDAVWPYFLPFGKIQGGYLSESIRLFMALRERGIRAHQWV